MDEQTIRIVGLGNAGCRVIDGFVNVAGLVAINTDAKSLGECSAHAKLQIGSGLTKGLGTGGDGELGRRAAEVDLEMIRGLFEGVKLVFVVVGLGGGTGTGAAPVVLRAAREAGASAICIGTLPFEFEGPQRSQQAQEALTSIRGAADGLIAVPNGRLFESLETTGVAEAFQGASRVLASAIDGIWKLITRPAYIDLDFPELMKVIGDAPGLCCLGYGEGQGTDKAAQAIRMLVDGPILERGQALARAASVMVSVRGGNDLTLKEIGDVMEAVSGRIGPKTKIVAGTSVDTALNGKLVVMTVVAEAWTPSLALSTGPDGEEAPAPAPVRTRTRRGSGGSRATQTVLPLETPSRGRFKDTEPTILDGEDLDIPTFIRRGMEVKG
jgi:cell division protein FtsZ